VLEIAASAELSSSCTAQESSSHSRKDKAGSSKSPVREQSHKTDSHHGSKSQSKGSHRSKHKTVSGDTDKRRIDDDSGTDRRSTSKKKLKPVREEQRPIKHKGKGAAVAEGVAHDAYISCMHTDRVYESTQHHAQGRMLVAVDNSERSRMCLGMGGMCLDREIRSSRGALVVVLDSLLIMAPLQHYSNV
jgi:hypothetical protein